MPHHEITTRRMSFCHKPHNRTKNSAIFVIFRTKMSAVSKISYIFAPEFQYNRYGKIASHI